MINNLCYECIFYLTNAASKASAAAANAAALTPPQRHRMAAPERDKHSNY